jgi:hypothetical protein
MIDMRGRLVTTAILATVMAPAGWNSRAYAQRIRQPDLWPRLLAFLDDLPRAPRLG